MARRIVVGYIFPTKSIDIMFMVSGTLFGKGKSVSLTSLLVLKSVDLKNKWVSLLERCMPQNSARVAEMECPSYIYNNECFHSKGVKPVATCCKETTTRNDR